MFDWVHERIFQRVVRAVQRRAPRGTRRRLRLRALLLRVAHARGVVWRCGKNDASYCEGKKGTRRAQVKEGGGTGDRRQTKPLIAQGKLMCSTSWYSTAYSFPSASSPPAPPSFACAAVASPAALPLRDNSYIVASIFFSVYFKLSNFLRRLPLRRSKFSI